jgi:acyl-CoA synthetase (AMP-forming)/AMP-acid ligase II
LPGQGLHNREEVEKTATLYTCVRELLDEAGSRVSSAAIVAGGRMPLTYARLCEQVEYVVSVLNDHGVGRNGRIAVVLPNGPEMAVTFLGVIAGAACAPLNPSYVKHEFDFYLADINARALIVQAGSDSPAREAAREKGIPVIELVPAERDAAGVFTLECESGVSKTARERGFSRPDDTALILHTSGTTSRPKIVPLTHRNILSSARNVGISLQLTPADRCLNVMPLFHIHGLIAALLATLNTGGSVVCTPGFSESAFFDWLEEFRPTWYTSVPTIHQSVLELAERKPVSAKRAGLRFIRSSSSSLPPAIMERLENVFGVPVIEAYGMTEASHQMACNPLPPSERKPGSVGLAAGPEISVMDENDAILSAGETGEIVIRGDNVMTAYENNPEANGKAFSKGWFRTGDQGYFDDRGYLYLTGRLKEIINRGGQKIYPRDIDEALLEHPAVRQAVSFSVPHSRLGEAVAAAVVLEKGKSVTERELREHVAGRLAPYKIPQQIVFVDSIPKGPTGKLQRIGLAERLSHLLTPEYAAPATEAEILVAGIWQEVLGLTAVGRHDNFFALGGNSLSATMVISRIIRILRIDVPLLSLFQHTRLDDFSAVVYQHHALAVDAEELSLLLAEIEGFSDEEVERQLGRSGEVGSEG